VQGLSPCQILSLVGCSLCSTVVTPLHRSYGPLRNPLLFGRLPGVTGYTTYLAPPISRREEEGFSSCLARPCHRAAATTPPESSNRVSQPATLDAAFTLSDAGSASGASHFRGHLCVRLRCGPVTRSHPTMTLSMGFRSLVSLLPAIQATRRLALASAGLTPAKRASLRWTHNRT